MLAQEVGIVQSDILILDPDRLFSETLLGQRITADLQLVRDKLIASNRKIEAKLEAEEKELTELRAQKSAAEFRVLADAFDTKVQQIRQDSERTARDLERNRDRAPLLFMRTIEPVLVQLMRDAGGAVIMDRRSVLLNFDVIDITDVAISKVDAAIGDGQEPQQDANPPSNDD